MNQEISAYVRQNWLELAGVATGIVCVWYNTRQNVLGWVWGMVNVVIYAYIFFNAKLYADTGLQVVFFVLSGYGLYQWVFGGENQQPLPVSRLPRRFLVPALLTFGLTWAGLAWGLSRFTDASLPVVDSATTVVSLIAQWMLARKYLENWLLWLGADVVYVGMYAYKELYWTSLLYFVFLGLAVKGYLAWRRSLSEPGFAGF